MALWLLKARDDSPLWRPWYDKTFGFVVRAPNEQEARRIAQENGSDEVRGKSHNEREPAWTSPEHSACLPLSADGPCEIILEDNHAA